jgi:hypothetical protein
MSTSISRGFKLKTTDLFQIQQYMMAWRDELRQVHRDSVARLLATKTSDMIDEAATSPGLHGGRKPLSAANRDFRDRQREIVKSGYRDPEVDFEFRLELMPYDGCVYGIARTEREEWWKLFLSKDFVEDYSYWDASEGPDDVAESEWEDRRVTWNAIFKSSIMSLISMTSLSVTCTYELVHVEVDADLPLRISSRMD